MSNTDDNALVEEQTPDTAAVELPVGDSAEQPLAVEAAPAPAVETPEGEDGEKNDTPETRMTNARSMVADLLGKKKEG